MHALWAILMIMPTVRVIDVDRWCGAGLGRDNVTSIMVGHAVEYMRSKYSHISGLLD